MPRKKGAGRWCRRHNAEIGGSMIKINPYPEPNPIKAWGIGFTQEQFTEFLIRNKVLSANEIAIRLRVNKGFLSFTIREKTP